MKYYTEYHIFNKWLYKGKYRIGLVRYIDYCDNGNHGYGISQIKDYSLLRDFEMEAKKNFPNVENPYIEYLDKIYK